MTDPLDIRVSGPQEKTCPEVSIRQLLAYCCHLRALECVRSQVKQRRDPYKVQKPTQLFPNKIPRSLRIFEIKDLEGFPLRSLVLLTISGCRSDIAAPDLGWPMRCKTVLKTASPPAVPVPDPVIPLPPVPLLPLHLCPMR